MTNRQQQTDITGPGFGVTFLYYFSMTTLIVVLIGVQALHWSPTSALLYRYGMALGMLAGLVGTYFNRTIRLEMAVDPTDAFVDKMSQVLSEMGFQLDEPEANQSVPNRLTLKPDQDSDKGLEPELNPEWGDSMERYLIYQRPALASLFGGKVYVKLRPNAITIASRARTIRQLRQKL